MKVNYIQDGFMKSKIYEKDLYAPVKEFFECDGYTVKSEVKECDIVAVKDGDLIITELKLSLNLEVILQAVQRQKMNEKVYIAVPVPKINKRYKKICDLLKRLEIGLILVYVKKAFSYVRVEMECKNCTSRIISTYGKRKKKKLEEEFHLRHGDNNTGGVTREKLITAYREKSLYIAGLMKNNGPLSAKELRALGAAENAHDIIYQNHYRWFEKVERGKYQLSEYGLSDIENYSELINVLLDNSSDTNS